MKIKEFLQFSIKNSGTLFLLKLIGLCLNYIVLLLILHYYDFKGNGEYAVILELARGLKVFIVFGLDYLLVKELTSNIDDKKDDALLLGATFLVNNLLFVILFALFNNFFDIDINIFFWTIFMSTWRFISHYFRGKDNMAAYGFFEFIIFQLLAVLSILCSNFVFREVEFETLINILNIGCITIISLVFFPKFIVLLSYKSLIETIKVVISNIHNIYKKGIHFVLTNSTNILSVSILYIIIKNNYSSEVLGIYDTVLKFSMIVSLPLIATSGRVMTLASKYFNENKIADLGIYINKITKMLIIVSTLCAFGVGMFFWVYSEYFNEILQGYWLLFIILVGAQLVNNWTGPVGIVLQVSENEKTFNKITMLTGAYLIISTFILANFFDIYIIAINMLFYLSCVNYFSLKVQAKRLGIKPHYQIFKKEK